MIRATRKPARFALHPQLARDSVVLGDLSLCRLLLMNDAQYPWFILVPRRAGIREIYDLPAADQSRLLQESVRLSRVLMTAFKGEKLNIAALGNMVPQLHLHHVVRFRADPSWPAPVWGRRLARPYSAAEMRERLAPLAGPLRRAGFKPKTASW